MAAPPEDKRVAEGVLVGLLRKHAYAVCWQVLGERCPEVVNWGVFLALHHAASFRGEAKFSSWFHGVMRNLCLSYIRLKILRRREIAFEDLPEGEIDKIAVGIGADPIMELGVRQLRPEDAQLLEMKLAGYRLEEIATILGIGIAAVRMRWYRLRKRIAEAVG